MSVIAAPPRVAVRDGLIRAALEYAGYGWPVFPCHPATKAPLTPHGFHDASTEQAIIQELWSGCPDAMIGVATGTVSGIAVLDIDIDLSNGLDGEIALASLLDGHELPVTLTARTPRGGRHIYFNTQGFSVKNSAGKLGIGLDVRGDGGYVIVPPSVNAQGKSYRWEPDWGPIHPVPECLVPHLTATRSKNGVTRPTAPVGFTPAYGRAALTSECNTVANTPEGRRNDQLYRSGCNAGELIAGGYLDEGEARAALTAAATVAGLDNDANCGLSGIEKTIDSGIRAGEAHPRAPVSRMNTSTTLVTNVAAAQPPPRSEEDLARRFAEAHKDDLRYVNEWGKWFVWKGDHWAEDKTLMAFNEARTISSSAASEAENPRAALTLASAKTVTAVERLAKADRRLAATADQWDQDPNVFNTRGVAIDLATGAPRPARPDDYATKRATVAPAAKAECPQWLEFLSRVTGGDRDLVAYLQRVVGYCLTGHTREHALFFLYGTGSNGKRVFVNTVSSIMGDYAVTAPIETFTETRQDRHETELARLQGARLVTANETVAGKHWNEARIKMLTGGDKVPARFMRQDYFEYVPQFKLMMSGNHKPALRSVGEAMRRRLHLIPFMVTIPLKEQDHELPEKLKKEWPGILRWAIEGTALWRTEGLKPPQVVVNATAEYFDAEDDVENWIKDCCVRDANATHTSTELYLSWKNWAERTGRVGGAGSQTNFSKSLAEKGFAKDHSKRGTVFAGLLLNNPPDDWTR